MAKFFKRQDGVTPIVAVLVILVVGIVGVAALRTSDAYWMNVNKRPRPTVTRPNFTFPSTGTTGSNATCTVNGVQGTTVNGQCSANSGATGSCTVNGVTQPLVNGTCQATSPGTPGVSRCTVNGQEVPCQ
jgi:hypothetical protein